MMFLGKALSVLMALSVGITAYAAKPGGTYNLRIKSDPETVNPMSSTDAYASAINGYVMDSLLGLDEDTYELKPGMANKWEVSKDGMEVVFHLREGLKWHDGKPVTAEDIKFSFEYVWEDKYNAAHKRPYFESVGIPEIIDAKTLKFKFKKKYFQNLEWTGGVSIVPKHIYADTSKKMNKTAIGSGPYKYESNERGKRIVLTKNTDWWGFSDPKEKNQYYFDKILFRPITDDTVGIETFKKGEVDFIELTPEQFELKAVGPEWGKKVLKIKTQNRAPKGYSFIGLNQNNELFKDKNVRRALSHLYNRELMNQKFRFGLSYLAACPAYNGGDYFPDGVKPIEYNPKKALAMLKASGWEDKDKNGILEKEINGVKKEFKFSIMTANADTTKYLTIFKEDAKKAGVDIEVKLIEWNSMLSLLDDRKYDAVQMGWGAGGVEGDLKQIWHSASAIKGGSNFIDYKNPELDKLIDETRETMDKEKRRGMWKKANKIIAEDAPYIFSFAEKNVLYGVNSRIKRPKDTYKYSVGANFWWVE